jgi:uncharacterized protein YbaP (TraB family)
MKSFLLGFSFLLVIYAAHSQDVRDTAVENTFFWKVTSPGLTNPSYLYGTIHQTCATDVWFSPLLLGILKSCKIFYMETLDLKIFRDSAIMIGKTKNGMKAFLGGNYFRSGRKTLEKYYGPFTEEQLDNMGTREFGEKLIEACRGSRVISYDDSLYNLASQYNLELRGLEITEEIIKYAPKNWHVTPDREWFRNYISYKGIYRRTYLRDIGYYKNHDINTLYKLSVYDKAGKDLPDKTNYVDGRNQLWLPRIEAAMKEGSCFIAVGCGHLPGYNGLITQLRKKGYTVTPLFYSVGNQ